MFHKQNDTRAVAQPNKTRPRPSPQKTYQKIFFLYYLQDLQGGAIFKHVHL
jgi:hypothetical protein